MMMGVEEFSYYDDFGQDKPRWKILSKLPANPHVGHCDSPEELDIPTLVTKTGQIYTAGLPTHSNSPGGSFSRFNTVTGEWDDLEEMLLWSYQFSMVELDGYIYTLAGAIEDRGTDDKLNKNVARYSIARETWDEVAPMVEGVEASFEENKIPNTAIVFDGKILVSSTVDTPENPTDDVLIVEMYDPVTNIWCVVLKDKCRKRSQAVLTVQNNVCYLLMLPYKRHEIILPNVYTLNRDFDAKPPKASLGEGVIQNVTLTNNTIGAFCINDDIFVNVWGCVYELKTEGQKEVDVSKWSDIIPDPKLPFTAVMYTFDKRLCI